MKEKGIIGSSNHLVTALGELKLDEEAKREANEELERTNERERLYREYQWLLGEIKSILMDCASLPVAFSAVRVVIPEQITQADVDEAQQKIHTMQAIIQHRRERGTRVKIQYPSAADFSETCLGKRQLGQQADDRGMEADDEAEIKKTKRTSIS